jgi:dTDP-4-amino-4,6-dideoxy-D-galactose acyltransferase
MITEYLSWDSAFFNKKTGKINYNIPDETKLKKILEKAKTEQYQLLYIFVPEKFCIRDEILKVYSGKLVDRRILYSQYIENLLEHNQFAETVTLYSETVVSDELENLAYLSGQYSRFHLDKNFEPDTFHRLYKTWVTKSVQKKMDNSVFIVKNHDTIVGMVTLKYGEKIGTIGLIAVSELAQGKGYGKKLINACIYDLYKRNISTLEVPTQANNIPACRFYEKCGFSRELITNIYHFWP